MIVPQPRPLLVFGPASAYVSPATAFHQLERVVVLTIRIRRLARGNPPPTWLCSFAPRKHSLGVEKSGVRMTIGTVKFFNSGKGFGFVTPEGGGKDIFVHVSAVEAAGMSSLSEGQRISFETQSDPKGSKAVNLKAA
jgi:CspA family cold shock protein